MSDNLLSDVPAQVAPSEPRPDLSHAASPVGTVSPGPADSAAAAGVELRGEAGMLGRVVDQLKTVYDPEIPVNIYELGLVYGVEIDPGNAVLVRMTLTSPACPVAGSLPGEVEQKVRSVDGVSGARVELVWEPPWSPAKMSEEAKLLLNLPY